MEIVNFQGTTIGSSNIFPPDTMGAKGSNFFVELINNAFATYKPDGTLLQRMTLKQFWDDAFLNTFNNPIPGVPPPSRQFANDPFDPRVLYDFDANRWYAVSADDRRSADSRILIAVTTGTDPSPGNWRGFSVKADPSGTSWADFPRLGHSKNGVYIAVTMPVVSGSGFGTPLLLGIPKTSLTAPTPGIGSLVRENSNALGRHFQPAVDLGPLGFPYRGLSIKGDPATSIETLAIPDSFLSGVALGSPTSIPVPGDALIEPGNIRYPPSSGLKPIETKTLQMSFTSNVVNAWNRTFAVIAVKEKDRPGGSSIRWFEINATTNQMLHSGLIHDTPGGLELFYPSIAVNGFMDMVVGFAAMPDGHPAAPGGWAVAGQMGLNLKPEFSPTFRPVQFGSDSYELLDDKGRNRWGDYSATTYDFGGGAFWTIQEYAPEKDVWATRIAAYDVINDVSDVKFPAGIGGGGGTYGSMGFQHYDGDKSMEFMRIRGSFGSTNVPDELTKVGDSAVEEYDLLLDARLRLGADVRELRDLPARARVRYTLTSAEDRAKMFDTELLSLVLQDHRGLPLGFDLELDPDRPSLGQVRLLNVRDGDTRMKSYFDLFTRITLDSDHDGRVDRTLATDLPSHLFLRATPVPAPSTYWLLALGAVGLSGFGLRQRKRAPISARR
jgi:hypothetical protein